jgi:hypothetical protein
MNEQYKMIGMIKSRRIRGKVYETVVGKIVNVCEV